MVEVKSLHVDLVDVAIGRDVISLESCDTVGECLLRSHLSVDILFWLLDNWVAFSNK